MGTSLFVVRPELVQLLFASLLPVSRIALLQESKLVHQVALQKAGLTATGELQPFRAHSLFPFAFPMSVRFLAS